MLSAMGGPLELAFETSKPGVEIVLIARQMPISQQEFALRHEWVTLLIRDLVLTKSVSAVFATLFCEWTSSAQSSWSAYSLVECPPLSPKSTRKATRQSERPEWPTTQSSPKAVAPFWHEN